MSFCSPLKLDSKAIPLHLKYITLCMALCGTNHSFAAPIQTSSISDLLSLSLEEILNISITSTSYFSETSLTAGSTVSVISHQDWEKRGARRFNDALLSLPSVVALPNFLGQDSIRIRGYALSDARGVATLWDGVSITTFFAGTSDVDRQNIQLNSLNSIEVIRGPGSALYGSDAFHGVVSLNTFESDKDVSIINARAGTTGFYSTGYNGSTEIGDGWRLNMSLSSSGQPDQDIAYNYSGGTGERDFNYQSNTLVAKLASDAKKTWSYKFGFYYDDNDSNDFHGQGGQGGSPERDIASVDSEMSMVKFDVKYNISKLKSLSLETYYWDQTHVFERPVNATRDVYINGDEHREALKLVYRDEKFTKSTQISAALSIRHDEIDLQHRRVFNATTTFADVDLPYSGTTRKINSFLIDGKTTLENLNWTLRYGFRVDDYSDFGSQFTPRFGAIYKLDNESVIKALYGQSFRAAAANEVGGSGFIAGDPNIKPEELDTFELVYLKQTKGSKLEVVVFKSEWTNGIAATDTDNDTFDDTFANVSENNSYGLEFSFQKKYEKWLIETSGSYVKSESDTEKLEYTAFPKYIFNLGIGYDFESEWALYVNNRVHIDATEGPARATVMPNDLKDYWRMDVNLTKSFKDKWQVYGNIRNLLNRKNFIPSLVNAEGGIPEDEISMDAGVRYLF